jgi:exportin-5
MADPTAGDLSEASLIQALEIVYDPRSKNETRLEATIFLDRAKESPEAFSHGFVLASDSKRPPILRHYGLSMMLYHLKYIYHGGRADELRECVLRLTESVTEGDPPFLKNKVVQIWTEVTKRIWGQGWNDMDEQLFNLWSSTPAHKEFVLLVLETLSEDIFSREEYVAGLRADLGSSFARICVTQAIMEEHYRPVQDAPVLRYGEEGWLQRLCEGLRLFLEQYAQQPSAQVHSCIVRGLAAVQSLCSWISPKAIISSNCVETVGMCFAAGDTAIRMAALDAFSSIFSRLNMETEDMANMVRPLFTQESLQLLHDAYGWARTAGPDEDDDKYVFAKKLSEVMKSIFHVLIIANIVTDVGFFEYACRSQS